MELLQRISKYFREEQLILKTYAFLELQMRTRLQSLLVLVSL